MAGESITQLQRWFKGLTSTEQREVYRFLYGDTMPMTDAYNLGPNPLIKSLNLGATPMNVAAPKVCPSCGKPL